ncbi:Cof-type HAD-IIB family hydrolase [Enterococcus sp. CSURQ0835]|uniref:Cof-type HAD-IIB family hydrolase n=1 Tax=Enterococcus sp. CSURQ0835 TaxID=2681394 RepID=UPI0013568337|nr:Cof-type HAD-IIB family hydrolase [Enterococcus sp. CSURQ0835]
MELIAVDLDGTLLNSAEQVSPQNIKALQAYRKQGGLVTVVTGRSIRSVKKMLLDLEIMDYALTSNGAYIAQITPDCQIKKIKSFALATSTAQTVLTLTKQHRLTTIASEETQDVRFEFAKYPQLPLATKAATYLKLAITDAVPEKLVTLQQQLANAKISSVFSAKHFLEVTAENVSKASALQTLAQQLDLSPNQIMAFGDQQNDLAMLHYSGTSIAMGNATPSVKRVADHVTKTNDEAGIAYFLQHYL